MPNGADKRLNFTPKVWDSVAGAYRPFYIAPDGTDTVQGDVKLSDATDSTLNAATGMTAATPAAVNAVRQSVASKLDMVTGADQSVASKVTFNNTVVLNKGATVATGQVITGNLQGNATTATTLQTSRTISLTGRVTGSTNFNGGANATINTTIAAGSIVTADLAAGAVTTEKLANDSVTNDKVNFNYAGSAAQGGDANSSLKLTSTVLTNQDLDSLRDDYKTYYAAGGNSCTNKPSGVDNFGLISWKIASGHYGQLLQYSGELYIRFYNASSWNAWTRVGYVEDGSITTAKLADNSVTSAKIVDGTIAANDVGFNYAGSSSKGGVATSAAKLATARTISFTGNVTGSGSFDGSNNLNIGLTIADNAVTTAKISDAAITSAKIADGTIVDGDIANTTITGGKLVNGTITSTQLAANAVITDKINNSAVTTAKLANASVTTDKIADGTILLADLNGAEVGTVYIGSTEPTAAPVKLWVKP